MNLQEQLTAMTRHVAATLVVAAGTIGVAQAGTVTVVPNVTITAAGATNTTGSFNTVNINDVAANTAGTANFPIGGNYYYGTYSAGPWSLAIDVPAAEGVVKGTLNGAAPLQTYAAPVDAVSGAVSGYYLSTGGYGATSAHGTANAPSGVYQGSSLTGDIQLSFTTPQAYFGLLWGSIGTNDLLSFYSGSTLITTITGATALSAAQGTAGFTGGGCQIAGCSDYFLVNFLNGQTYTSVVFGNYGSTAPSFESANFQYATKNVPGTTTVPEPASVALLGVGLAGLFAARRRRA